MQYLRYLRSATTSIWSYMSMGWEYCITPHFIDSQSESALDYLNTLCESIRRKMEKQELEMQMNVTKIELIYASVNNRHLNKLTKEEVMTIELYSSKRDRCIQRLRSLNRSLITHDENLQGLEQSIIQRKSIESVRNMTTVMRKNHRATRNYQHLLTQLETHKDRGAEIEETMSNDIVSRNPLHNVYTSSSSSSLDAKQAQYIDEFTEHMNTRRSNVVTQDSDNATLIDTLEKKQQKLQQKLRELNVSEQPPQQTMQFIDDSELKDQVDIPVLKMQVFTEGEL